MTNRNDSSPDEKRGMIDDITFLKQDPLFYAGHLDNAPLLSPKVHEEWAKQFHRKWYSPWTTESFGTSREKISQAFDSFRKGTFFGENTLPIPPDLMDKLYDNANIDSCGNLNRKAISVIRTNLRILPTDLPFFGDPQAAGEGYPFDKLQESAVKAQEPLLISHLSEDGRWAYVRTSFGPGWIDIRDLAFVDDESSKMIMSCDHAVVIRDGLPIKDEFGRFLFTTGVGALMPLADKGPSLRIQLAVRNECGRAKLVTARIPENAVTTQYLVPTSEAIANIAKEMMGEPYGWGGRLFYRDCSSTMKDIFAPFGIWLPRNSGEQAAAGNFISLKGLGSTAKKRAILERGTPWATLVHKPGHIMLYIGDMDGEPLVMHNVWGIRTQQNGKEGRHVIGRCVITTLEPGIELPDVDPEKGIILNSVTGLALLTSCPLTNR